MVMKNEYVVINKTELLKEIESLEDSLKVSESGGDMTRAAIESYQIDSLKWVLSQSTPFIPEIEKAFNAAKIPYKYNNNMELNGFENSEHYISNLKLDI